MIRITHTLLNGTLAIEQHTDEVGILLPACGFEWHQGERTPGVWALPGTAHLPANHKAIAYTASHLRNAGICVSVEIEPWIPPQNAACIAQHVSPACPKGYGFGDIALGDLVLYPELTGTLYWGRVGSIDRRTIALFWSGQLWAYTRIIPARVIELRRPIDREQARRDLSRRILFRAPTFSC
ncbi:hypothetical protein [Streptosporangium sandarakinum]|uniref:hypothetical protein n=1 Tax=Streptosporangium sandarakinum TaxID=1260955 RepID=UPI0037A35C3D